MINQQKLYDCLRLIPKGKVTTYKILSEKMNCKSHRAIGTMVGKNKDIPATPCHRVVKSNGEIGGYAMGADAKIELLKSEGIEIKDKKITNFDKFLYKF